MPAPLRCPTCSAPLDPPPPHTDTLRCPYCGAGVLLTERSGHVEAAAAHQRHTDAISDVLRSLRAGNKINAIKLYREHFGVGLAEAKYAVERLEAGQSADTPLAAGAAPGRAAGARPAEKRTPRFSMAGGAFILLIAIVVFLLVQRSADPPASAPQPQTASPAPSTAPPTAASPLAEQPKDAGFAQEIMRFGSAGTGAGRFEDARSVAVDGSGRIYVAEYSGGRVQVFDSAGTFITQWMADPKMPLLDMEADRGGTVYVVQSGRIRRYEGTTGRALGEFGRQRQQAMGYRSIALALDGSLWAVHDGSVVHLSRDGEVLKSIDLKQAVDEDASPERVAVSGTGDLYVLDQWKADVYHLNPEGRFVDRFGGGGFPPAEDVVVDGRGRVFVSDLRSSVSVFDRTGQPLGDIGGMSVVFGMAVNDRDELFAAARNDNAVVKLRVKQ